MTIDELAGKIRARYQGDGTRSVESCAGLEDAGPGQVSFLANRKYGNQLKNTRAGAVVLAPQDAPGVPKGCVALLADDPYYAFCQAVVALHGFRKHPAPGIDARAFIDPTAVVGELCTVRPFVYIAPRAQIGKRCIIYPHCYMGKDVQIGDDCILYPNVTIYDGCTLGHRVTLHAGCVIGQDGFGYATHEGSHHKIPQVGRVVIEDDVEMGANCTVDRATVGQTRVGQGSKFSDLVAIGHGATIGRHNLLVAQVGVAGSSTTGDYVALGGQVGVAGHLSIGDKVQVAAQSGVTGDLASGQQYGGSPAIPLAKTKRSLLLLPRLPDLMRDFRRLQKRVAELESRLGESAPAADADDPEN